MSIELCVLASGSSGNASVVRTPAGAMLIDCGIGPRVTVQRLLGTGVDLSDISAICLTHLDSDHFSANWIATALRGNIAIHCHADRMHQVLDIAGDRRVRDLIRPFSHHSFEPIPGLAAQPIRLAHDREGSHAFVFTGFGHRVGYATDLGRVPPGLIEQFVDLDVLAIESNYDPRMQASSPRPAFLKRRITGGHGHLSNQQALDAIRQILDLSERQSAGMPGHIVLLHRSRQCNCPRLVRALFSADARIAPRLVLAEPDSRTEWMSGTGRNAAVGEQLLLAWG
ncbi:MAG TPA: MBL fold metallo-hydrolase [Tepidisphaeraceae bacterium]|jgi:phosphoribosyl 1,2-cyclic phosphodiesterase|nr:MBL fold metallo-hydrolase [Tepidisphaeraceae bacterium]